MYGRSGTGKTTFAATFPKPLLIIDIGDRGTDSITEVRGVNYIEPESFEEVENIFWELKSGEHKYKSVVIDTISQLQRLRTEEELERKGKNRDEAGKWGALTRQDYGRIASDVKKLLSNMRDLPMQTIYIAQDKVQDNDEDGVEEGLLMPEVGPRVSKSVAADINANASVIGSTFIRQKTTTSKKRVRGKFPKTTTIQFCLRIGPDPIYITKIRKPKTTQAPPFIVNPTYEKLANAIKGESTNG